MSKPVYVDSTADNPAAVSALDDCSLWSAPFGLAVLERVPLARGMQVLDFGCGTGFPLLELSQRLGASCALYGLDPWEPALERARFKISARGIANVTLVSGNAEQMPFADSFFDLIVSNNGINNVERQQGALAECFRVGKPGATMILTYNLPMTMKEFYNVFEESLRFRNLPQLVEVMNEHITHKRRPLSVMTEWTINAGFLIEATEEDTFLVRYTDGSAFLNAYDIRSFWAPAWKEILPESERADFFRVLEHRLNDYAQAHNGLELTIPFAVIVARKP